MRLRRPSMTRRGMALPVAAVIAASLTLGGCEVLQRPGSVAFVDGKALSVQDLAVTTKQFNEHFVTDPSQRLTEVKAAGTLVLAKFVVDYVEAAGTWKPDSAYASDLAKVPDATERTKDLLKFRAISTAKVLTQKDVEAILARISATRIEMDPRYGIFDPKEGGFVDRQNNWLVPKATATDAPGQPRQ